MRGRYVIVGSATYVSEEQHAAPLFHDIYRNNESICPNPRSPLEDCTLHIVSISTGHVTDRRRFRCDKIYLSHNQGVYLYGSTLAVLSVQQQTIHIFRISSDGMFIDLRSIGRYVSVPGSFGYFNSISDTLLTVFELLLCNFICF